MNLEEVKKEIYKEKNIYRRFYNGFEYWIIRPMYNTTKEPSQYRSVHLCGYVVIPRDSQYYISDDYNDYNIECHGGLTFANSMDFLSIDFCIGFDCHHYNDIGSLDFDELSYFGKNAKYRNVEYIDKECKSIIDQLKTLVSNNKLINN